MTRIQSVETVGSTNSAMKAMAEEGAEHGFILVADRQTAGRGRLARSWVDAGEGNLYASVLLRPNLAPQRAPLLCLGAALALAETCGQGFGIKWPNDVLAPNGGKVAGILAEMELEAGKIKWVVIGVGVNLRHAPAEVPGAETVSNFRDLVPEPLQFAEEFGSTFLSIVDRLGLSPGFFMPEYRRWDVTVGRKIRVGTIVGEAIGVEDDGSLMIEDAQGLKQRIMAGDVEMLSY